MSGLYGLQATSAMGAEKIVKVDLKDSAGNARWTYVYPAGSHDAQLLLLIGRNLVRSGIKVVRVDVGEQREVGLKLPTAGPSEG